MPREEKTQYFCDRYAFPVGGETDILVCDITLYHIGEESWSILFLNWLSKTLSWGLPTWHIPAWGGTASLRSGWGGARLGNKRLRSPLWCLPQQLAGLN